MKRICFLFLFFVNVVVYSSEVKTAEVPFKKTVWIDKKQSEMVEGTIYFTGEENLLIKVHKPLNQIVIINKFTNIFYYPDENSGISIIYSRPVVSQTRMQFDLFSRDDLGLSEAGYKVEKSYKTNDILMSLWVPPDKYKKQLGNVEIGLRKNRIVLNRMYSPDGKLLLIAEYDEFEKIGDVTFPKKIKTTTFQNKVVREEEIIYINPKINTKIPEEILNFKIPETAKIKEKKW
ncbi:MAG: LolA family protein [Brevinematia bacterium]